MYTIAYYFTEYTDFTIMSVSLTVLAESIVSMTIARDQEHVQHSPLCLQDLSLLYLVSHIKEYPLQELALLPESMRLELLRSVAPVHLCLLDRTEVASGINTTSIWEEISETGMLPWYTLDFPGDSMRESFIQYTTELLFTRAFNFSDTRNPNSYYEMVFGIHKERLNKSVANCLPYFVTKTSTDYFIPCCSPPVTEMDITKYLVSTNAHPTCLQVCTNVLVNSALWRGRDNGVLDIFLSKIERITIHCTDRHSTIQPSYVLLKTIIESPHSELKCLEIEYAVGSLVPAITPLFSASDAFNSLTVLSIAFKWGVKMGQNVGTSLATVIHTQLHSLESVALGRFSCDSRSEVKDLFVSLAEVMVQPHCRKLRLFEVVGLPSKAIEMLTTAYTKSYSKDLTLVFDRVNMSVTNHCGCGCWDLLCIHSSSNWMKKLRLIHASIPTKLIEQFSFPQLSTHI